MGLDCFWTTPNRGKVIKIDFDPPLNLCGGTLSQHGSGSFRGKVYNDVIETLTGVSLYDDLNEEQVRLIADTLETIDWDPNINFEYEIEEAEFKDLVRMFREYASIKACLTPWY